MRVTRLLSTTAAIVLISGGIAAAQGMKKDEQPARAPAAQQHAPAEKTAPPMAQHPAKPKETTGQGGAMTQGEHQDRNATPHAADKGMKSGEKSGEKAEMKSGEKSHESTAAEKHGSKSGEKAEMKNGDKTHESTSAEKQGTKSGEKAEMKNGANGENKSAAGASEKTEQRSTSGQGAAGAARLSSEQRTKITTIFHQHRVQPEHLNVSISVGVRVPEHVHLYPIPVEVVEVYPEWRGYDYILVGDQILVIDPRSHEIVAILEA